MNKIVKGILVFALGAGAGGYTGFYLGVRKCDQIVEEEAEQWRAAMKEKSEKLKEQKDQLIKDAEGIDELSASVTPSVKRNSPRENYKKIVGGLGYGKTDPSESPRMDKYGDAEEEYMKYQQMSAKDTNNSDRPYVITFLDFSEGMDHYDKSTIYFYEDDETLTDENEEIIVDVDAVVGNDSLDRFGDGSEDPEIVYVRNDKMQIDYEVIRLSKSYSETVLGFTEER